MALVRLRRTSGRSSHTGGGRTGIGARRIVDAIYLLAAIASASLVHATNSYLVEPVTLSLLYAIPVGLASYHFRYLGAAAASGVAFPLVFVGHSAQPGTLFFDVLVLCFAFVIVAGMLVAKIGSDRVVAETAGGIDRATGLASRRAIVGALSMELTRCSRYGRPISVLLAGLDGTEKLSVAALVPALKRVGLLLENSLRDVDVAGCYADRELMAVLPETQKEDALAVAERLRASIEQMRARLPGGHDAPPLTVSIAVVAAPEDARTVEGLLDAAEDTLFEARTLGGNRTRQARRLQVVSGGRDGDPRDRT